MDDGYKDLNLLHRLEWAGYAQGQGSGFMGSGGDGPHFPACYICGGIKPGTGAEREFMKSAIGHKKFCQLKKRIEELRSES